ncbi:unnamed protein product [Rhizopus stolonifer]
MLTRLSQNDFFGNIESVKILEIHDMTNLVTLNSVEYLTLNSVKFGTLWWLLTTTQPRTKLSIPLTSNYHTCHCQLC